MDHREPLGDSVRALIGFVVTGFVLIPEGDLQRVTLVRIGEVLGDLALPLVSKLEGQVLCL